LSDSTIPDLSSQHRAYICLGSNIDPETNMRRAVAMLREQAQVLSLSSCYETTAVGSDGPNFLNMAACLLTPLPADILKQQLLRQIEARLKRVREADKNAPRTIDLDIILYDDQVLDDDLWRYPHLALPFSELVPGLRHPGTGETLKQITQRLLEDAGAAVIRSEIIL
jgi:2-amino-4-hydroxy-6-hydroxymethyldihydropteridine diphosphokinase